MSSIVVEPVACLQDNFAYLVRASPDERRAVVVDASEPEAVRQALRAKGLRLAGIVSSHHHHDHVGGNAALCADTSVHDGNVVVVAGHYDVAACRIPQATCALADGESIVIAGVRFVALATPGHTLGATCFVVHDAFAAFTGDTLFVGGCGRLFEGDAAMMWTSLQRLRQLPDETQLHCGHDYTAKNRRFGLSILPGDPFLHAAAARSRTAAASARLGDERRENLFLRADDPAVQRALGVVGAQAAFARLRERRDRF